MSRNGGGYVVRAESGGSRGARYTEGPYRRTDGLRRMEEVGIEPETYPARRVSEAAAYEAESPTEVLDIEAQLERSLSEIRDVKNLLRTLLSKVDDLGRSTAENLDRLREEREIEIQRKREAQIREEERRASAAAIEAARIRSAEREREREDFYDDPYERGRAMVRNAVNLSPVDRGAQLRREDEKRGYFFDAAANIQAERGGTPKAIFRCHGSSSVRELSSSSRAVEPLAVLPTEEKVLGSIPALGTPESMPAYHHEHMYKEDNLLALYELYGEGALEGYKEIGEKFRETRGGLGPSGCTVTVEAEGVSKRGTKKLAIGKIVQHLPYDQPTMYWMWKKMCMDLERQMGVRSRSNSVAMAGGVKHRCDIVWERVGPSKEAKTWKGSGIGDSQEEAEVKAMEDIYRTVTGTHVGKEEDEASWQADRLIVLLSYSAGHSRGAQVPTAEETDLSTPGGAPVLSSSQASTVMIAYNNLVTSVRLADSATTKLDSNITFGDGVTGVTATIAWTWTEDGEKKSLLAKGDGVTKISAKAVACLSMLEQYGSVQPLPARVWQQSELINATLDRGDVGEGLRLATPLIRSGPVHALALFLLPLWRSVLASSDSTVTEDILEQLRRRSAKSGGVPVYLWEAMVDECANLSDHAYASSTLCSFLNAVKCEAFSDYSESYAHWRGLIGLERVTAIQNAVRESRDIGARPFNASVSRDSSPLINLRVSAQEAQGHDLSEGSLLMLFEPGAFYRSESGDLVSVLAVIVDADQTEEDAVFKLSLASREAELESKSREFSILSNTELSCLPLDDSNVSHSRMCEALRVLYEVPHCDNSLFCALKPGVKLKGGAQKERLRFDESMRDALLRSAPPFEPPTEDLPDLGMPLSENQRNVINGSWNVPLTLIQGPPGTGKTYTAVAIVKHWVRNKIRPLRQKSLLQRNEGRVLVVADSNAAADNIRGHLEKNGVECYRVGRMVDSQAPDLSETVEHYLRGHPLVKEYKKAVELGQLRRLPGLRVQMDKIAVNRFPVLVATCIGSGHPMLDGLTFDSVVIDECTQATEPATLVPLARGAKRCVLLGDHKQLSATVCSTAALERGFGTSLFERVLESGGRLHMLDVQRRMHPSIAEFSNINFYEGRISDAVGQRPVIPGLYWPASGVQVCLVDTNSVTGGETRVGTTFSNRAEAKAVIDAMVLAVEAGLDPEAIGIVVPYNGQKSQIEKALESDYRLSRESVSKLSINTVDAFQEQNEGLVVFGDVKTLTANPDGDWARWVDWARERGCMVKMAEYFKKAALIGDKKAAHTATSGKRDGARGTGKQPAFRTFPSDMWTRDMVRSPGGGSLKSSVFKRTNAR
ncbi:hypothetical protein FOZ60_015095 [Perkinsus olseni]|uniref:ATP-dependent helicase NAM7 n=1 Tax=Perkinsus olseni TaxID=32597 RepID=A0A7J6P706_PEROL|nr:hypothetical protein FOZ60_015095 [Perkinsus olseni]